MPNKRIWELDAFRGICVLAMIAVHFLFDLTELYGLVQWQAPDWFNFLQRWGGVAFVMLSGICATLGSRSFRRGCIVLACGLLVTAATWAMVALWDFDPSTTIRFGVLHCLGVCMMLWPLFRKWPVWLLGILGLGMVLAGFWCEGQIVQTPWLFPIGLTTATFSSGDYFPLLPHLGFFLLGAVLGKTLYRQRQTLFPRVPAANPVLRFFQFCGRHSLLIYLVHQPLLAGLCMLL